MSETRLSIRLRPEERERIFEAGRRSALSAPPGTRANASAWIRQKLLEAADEVLEAKRPTRKRA